jgi:O-antigen/teichoic acid export membrane protein
MGDPQRFIRAFSFQLRPLNSENNKRIAKNTAMLYFRMLLTMAISLYTSRIVLNTLGVEDFGIYNVVGGFVTMFGFLNSAMASATQRFLAFEIGRNDKIQLHNVFSMSLNIHFLIALIILVLAETVGLWFVNTQLTIPAERMVAARWVYQFSILTLMVNMVSVPYNAMIIAHERMNVFAWVSIAEVSLKLLIVFMLQWFGFDKLKFYAVLMFGVALLIRFIYGMYCNINFKHFKFIFFWNRRLFRKMLSFSGWNLMVDLGYTLNGQGINILLNIFFGPVVNAARGIAYQVIGLLNSFLRNFQMAINPQIIKLFATNKYENLERLIYQGTKYSFFLLFVLSFPVLLETESLLKIWLKTVPEYSVIFTQLIIINILIESLTGLLTTAAQATGNIKKYQGITGAIMIFIVPASYIFFKLNFPPETAFWIGIFFSLLIFIARIVIIKKLLNINLYYYFLEVIYKIIIVVLISLAIPFIGKVFIAELNFKFIIICLIAFFWTIVAIYVTGLESDERKIILHYLRKYFLIHNAKF